MVLLSFTEVAQVSGGFIDEECSSCRPQSSALKLAEFIELLQNNGIDFQLD